MLKRIYPQAHKYHTLLTFICWQSTLKYRSTISFIITFYGNNRYAAELRFVWSSVLRSRKAMCCSHLLIPPHTWRWKVLHFIIVSENMVFCSWHMNMWYLVLLFIHHKSKTLRENITFWVCFSYRLHQIILLDCLFISCFKRCYKCVSSYIDIKGMLQISVSTVFYFLSNFSNITPQTQILFKNSYHL